MLVADFSRGQCRTALLPYQLLQASTPSTPPTAPAFGTPHRTCGVSFEAQQRDSCQAHARRADTVSHAQRNLMRKLGLVLEEGPVLVEAVAAYNALFT